MAVFIFVEQSISEGINFFCLGARPSQFIEIPNRTVESTPTSNVRISLNDYATRRSSAASKVPFSNVVQ